MYIKIKYYYEGINYILCCEKYDECPYGTGKVQDICSKDDDCTDVDLCLNDDNKRCQSYDTDCVCKKK